MNKNIDTMFLCVLDLNPQMSLRTDLLTKRLTKSFHGL